MPKRGYSKISRSNHFFTIDLLRDLAKGFLRKQIEELTGVKLGQETEFLCKFQRLEAILLFFT